MRIIILIVMHPPENPSKDVFIYFGKHWTVDDPNKGKLFFYNNIAGYLRKRMQTSGGLRQGNIFSVQPPLKGGDAGENKITPSKKREFMRKELYEDKQLAQYINDKRDTRLIFVGELGKKYGLP